MRTLPKCLQEGDRVECYYEDVIIPFNEIKRDFDIYHVPYPEYLYHVSRIENKNAIAQYGIQPQPQNKKLWPGCNSNFTYWSRILKEAISFVGNIEKEDLVICFRVSLSKFNMNKLFVDRMLIANFEDYNVPITFEYHGGISSSNIELMSKDIALQQLNYEKTHENKIYSYVE